MSEPATTSQQVELSAEALADRIALLASDKKAQEIRVFDLRGIVSYTDFFVICTGNTERQTKAIHDAIYQELKDYLDCIVHIFTPDARSFYRLEQLWGDAPSRTVES
jgi:ribosome-associated protein